jgi:polysaccharide biosynthesis transport protein
MDDNVVGTNKGRQVESNFGLGGLEYYGLDDYKRLLLRRKWTIVFVTLAIALLASVLAYFHPDTYKAQTIIMIDPGKVPESYVRSTATLSASERLGLLREQIFSNTRLSQIIDEMGLYGNLKKTNTQDEILLAMRKDVELEPLFHQESRSAELLTAFSISYNAPTSTSAARVANRLASLFIDENLKAREEQVMGTAEFIDQQLAKARQNLANKGRALEELRSRHSSELPEAQNAHVQTMATLQLEVRGEMDAMSRAQQQKVYLQSMLADSSPIVDLDSSGSSDGNSGLEQQLARLQSSQDQLRARYGPNYPDVIKTQEQIRRVEKEIKKVKSSTPGDAAPPPSIVRRHNPIVESEIAALDEEMQKHIKRQEELKSEIGYHQAMLEKTPAIAQELTVLTRDYQQAEVNYKSLQDHKFSADISSDMESRQKGERFLILEPAQPPGKPYAPNRPLVDGFGLAAGLVMGVLLALGLEVLDATVKTAREVIENLELPVFGEIAWIATDVGKRRQRLRLLFAAGGNTVLMLAYLAVVAVSLRK